MRFTTSSSIYVLGVMVTGTLTLGVSTSVNAEPKSELIATLPALVTAAQEACDLDTLRSDPNWHPPGEFTFGPKAVDDGKTDGRNQEWLTKYNHFAGSENAKTLRQYAAALTLPVNSDTRLNDAECQIVVPAYGIAKTATALGVKPGDIADGPLTDTCESGKCVTKDLKNVARQCETEFRSKRYVEWCHTTDRKPITYGVVSEKPPSNANDF